MRFTPTPVAAVLCAALLPAGLAAASAGQPVDMRGAHAAPGEPTLHRIDVDGCDVLILWHTYRGSIDTKESEVRVRGALSWSKIIPNSPIGFIDPPPPQVLSNGRVYNWPVELRQERCDRNRRYRFRVVAPRMTGVPVRPNEPYAGTERWLYFPSSTGWTQKTTIDVGYLDLCVTDGTKCNKPYYPTGATAVLQGN